MLLAWIALLKNTKRTTRAANVRMEPENFQIEDNRATDEILGRNRPGNKIDKG